MAFTANGADFQFGGVSVSGADKISATVNGAEIDISTLAGAARLKEVGLPDLRFIVSGKGVPAPAICEQDTVEYIAPGASASAVLDNEFFVSERTISTTVDGAIVFSLKFTPSPTASS